MGIAETAGKVITTGVANSPVGRVIKIMAHTGGLSGQGDKEIEELGALDAVETAIGGGKEGKVTDAAKEKAQQRVKEMIEAELAKSCNANNSNCNKKKHNGRIQAQNGAKENQMIVTAVEANANWVDLPGPPSLSLCKLYAKSVRIRMLGVKGHSPDKKNGQKVDYEKGGTTAYNNLISWMEKNTPNGVGVSKWSFSFDGSKKQDFVGGDSRRIDIDIRTGEILKSV